MAIDPERLHAIRDGKLGLAVALYIDVDDDDWEDCSLMLPAVVALDREAGKRVVEALRGALEAEMGQEIGDGASEALSILLASSLADQLHVAGWLSDLEESPAVPAEYSLVTPMYPPAVQA